MSDFEFSRSDINFTAMQAVTESVEFQAVAGGATSLGELNFEIGEINQAAGLGQLSSTDTILVPIDVQAFAVPAGGRADERVSMPFVDASSVEASIVPFGPDVGPLAPGVHLHWALPDALLRGELSEVDGEADLGLSPLPDYWTVTRLVIPDGAPKMRVDSWVIDAATAQVMPASQASSLSTAPNLAPPLARGDLTAEAGGSLLWTGVYEASVGRFALHDRLEDLPSALASTRASYVVCGIWRTSSFDPLRSATSTIELVDVLEGLNWRLRYFKADHERTVRASSGRAVIDGLLSDGVRSDVGLGTFVESGTVVHPKIQPRPYRSMVHGVVHGVPVQGAASGDQRPSQRSMTVGFGSTDDLTLAAFTADGSETRAQKRDTETVVAAFTGRLLDRLGTADGVVDVAEGLHRSGFTSLPAADFVEDRYPGCRVSASACGSPCPRDDQPQRCDHQWWRTHWFWHHCATADSGQGQWFAERSGPARRRPGHRSIGNRRPRGVIAACVTKCQC